MGGNPAGVTRMTGDLPPTTDTANRALGRNLTAVLMGRGAQSSMQRVRGQNGTPAVPVDVKIPEWIMPDAHICYHSRSTNQKLEAVVELVNTVKCEVEVTLVDAGVWRVIPFGTIAGNQNPLFPFEALPPKPIEVEVGPAEESERFQDSVAIVDKVEEAAGPTATAARRSATAGAAGGEVDLTEAVSDDSDGDAVCAVEAPAAVAAADSAARDRSRSPKR